MADTPGTTFDPGGSYTYGGFDKHSKTRRFWKVGAYHKQTGGVPTGGMHQVWTRNGKTTVEKPRGYVDDISNAGWTRSLVGDLTPVIPAWREGTKTKGQKLSGSWIKATKTSYTPWTDLPNYQYSNVNGVRTLNPAYAKGVKVGSQQYSNGKWRKVGWAQTPWIDKGLTRDQASTRALTQYDYLAGQESANRQLAATNADLNYRGNTIQNDYQNSLTQLAQGRAQQRNGINQRAAKLGLTFSQGRENGLAHEASGYAAQLAQKLAGKTAAIGGIGVQAGQANNLAMDQTKTALNNTVDRLVTTDQAAQALNNPKINWQTPTSTYQFLDQKTGRAYKVVHGTKKYMP